MPIYYEYPKNGDKIIVKEYKNSNSKAKDINILDLKDLYLAFEKLYTLIWYTGFASNKEYSKDKIIKYKKELSENICEAIDFFSGKLSEKLKHQLNTLND